MQRYHHYEDDTTKVSISKTDITGDKEVPGAKLEITDKEGNVVEEWTSTTEKHLIEGKLTAGETYTLKETNAPDGYAYAEEVTFTVDETGKVTEVIMKDDVTKVSISKKDITGDAELPGAKLQVIDKEGNVVEEWISTNQPHEINGKLIAGETYTLHEEAAPDGYAYAADITFTVDKTGKVTTVVMKDGAIDVTISKQDITSGAELPGATLQILDQTGKVVETWISTDQPHAVTVDLVAGETYTLKETGAPDGYAYAEEIQFYH